MTTTNIIIQEITSLCSQLAYTYSVNRNASFPFSLVYTSLNGRTFTRLESMSDASYKRWANTEWWQEGYEKLWVDQGSSVADPTPVTGLSNESEVYHPNCGQPREIEKRKAVVYLTADSEDELTELQPDETYVIGGICDHNRYKVSNCPSLSAIVPPYLLYPSISESLSQ